MNDQAGKIIPIIRVIVRERFMPSTILIPHLRTVNMIITMRSVLTTYAVFNRL